VGLGWISVLALLLPCSQAFMSLNGAFTLVRSSARGIFPAQAPLVHARLPVLGSPKSSRRSSGLALRMDDAKEGGRGLMEKMPSGHKISYDFFPAANPTVVYLPALNQTRHGSKSFALQVWAKRNGQGYLSADYYGCGRSDGEYVDGTISQWTADTVHMLTEVVKGPVILVGAGVGGWIAMHVALRLPKQVKGIVGVAADPDFTTDVVLPVLDDETKQKIKDTGMANIVWGLNQYTISQKLIDDAEDMLLLQKGPKSVPIKCPVRLLQGLGDEEIPPNRALKISDALTSDDVVVTYAKFGDHVLDDEEDFRRMTNDVKELCSKFYEYDLSSPTSG